MALRKNHSHHLILHTDHIGDTANQMKGPPSVMIEQIQSEVTSPSRSPPRRLLSPRTLICTVSIILVLIGALCNQDILLNSVLKARSRDIKYFNTKSSDGIRSLTPLSLNYYPKGGPVIAVLVTNLDSDIEDLRVALRSLEFLEGDDPDFPTPVLVFNEGDLATEQTHIIIESTNRPIAFPTVVDFTKFPDGFEPNTEPMFVRMGSKRKKWGYYHMIRFWITEIWQHPALDPYETVMRIDSDSCFLGPNPHLPKFAHDHMVYHSTYVGYEFGKTRYIHGFYDFVQEYTIEHSIKPKNLMLWQFVLSAYEASQSLPVFQTNLEISRKSFMQRKDVKQFHETVTEKEPFGVFRYRWGDAVVRFITMALFADDEVVMKSPFVGYGHKEQCKKDEVLTALTDYLRQQS